MIRAIYCQAKSHRTTEADEAPVGKVSLGRIALQCPPDRPCLTPVRGSGACLIEPVRRCSLLYHAQFVLPTRNPLLIWQLRGFPPECEVRPRKGFHCFTSSLGRRGKRRAARARRDRRSCSSSSVECRRRDCLMMNLKIKAAEAPYAKNRRQESTRQPPESGR